MMPLRGENRVIVRDGLPRIADLPGLRALCEVAGIAPPAAGHRYRVRGRPAHQRGRADGGRAPRARALPLRRPRRGGAARRRPRHPEPLAPAGGRRRARGGRGAGRRHRRRRRRRSCSATPDWPMGIVGLVAGRIAERYARPTFIACLDPVEAKGSARSAGGVHIVKALDGAAPSLLRYGGHAAAAGFSLEASRFDEFRELITASVGEQNAGVERRRDFAIDCEISGIDVTPELCQRARSARAQRPGQPGAAAGGLRREGPRHVHVRIRGPAHPGRARHRIRHRRGDRVQQAQSRGPPAARTPGRRVLRPRARQLPGL